MTEDLNADKFSLALLRREALVKEKPPLPQTVAHPQKKIRRSVKFWLEMFVGASLIIALTVHGSSLNGGVFARQYLPIFWLITTLFIGATAYFIRQKLTITGSVIPRRAAQIIWLTFFAIGALFATSIWAAIKLRDLPAYFSDITLPIMFLFYLMAKVLERARISEAFPKLIALGCVAAFLSTLWTLGFPNQYFIAASWVGIIMILPNLQNLLLWD